MKIITDQISRHSTSINDLEVNSIQKLDGLTDVDQLKAEFKIFPEELSNLSRHIKDADPLQVEMGDYIMELPGDGFSVVEEIQLFDDPHEMCLNQITAHMDNVVQSAADVSSMELENFVSQECSSEIYSSAVRDICIDEGAPANDVILVKAIANGHKCIGYDSDAANETKLGSENVMGEVEWLLSAGLKSMIDEAYIKDFSSDSKVLVRQNESESEATGLVSSDRQKYKFIDTVVTEDIYAEEPSSEMSMESRCNDMQNTLHQESLAEFEDGNETLICSRAFPETNVEETADDSTVKSSDFKICPGHEETSNPSLNEVNNNKVELHTIAFHSQMADISQMSRQENLPSDRFIASSRIQPDHFESSFASVGGYTDSIAYSGSVAYSGSLSHRSDASTVSNRSFAFPVLQNEWNFSPVRMRKADRRHLGRRRGWMNGLFCCKF